MPDRRDDVATFAQRFRELGGTMRPRAPFYERLCAIIAERHDVAAVLGAAPPQQQVPVLLLAALHDQVLADPEGELAAWYPTATERPRTDDPTDALVRHCRRHDAALRHAMATRSTQTNEVGRCATLLPALGLVAAAVGPIALVDVGTSAGLNLRFDHYAYRFEPGGEVGRGDATVVLTAGTRGPIAVPDALPRVTARIGIDRSPINPHDDAETRWLEACVWPDQADRFHRLERAIDVARAVPADVRVADAVEGLAPAVTDARVAGGHPVVMSSWVLGYLTPERRVAFVAELDRIGAAADLSWVLAESPLRTPELPHHPTVADDERTSLALITWRDGVRADRHLGVAHPHGYWLHWADG
jgi:hypothetical protein